jgi:FecR protein
MNRLLLLLVPAALFAGQARYARLGEFDGKVEVQLHAGDPWSLAERNLPLAESAWLRTGASSRLEIELDDGSAWRLGADTQVEISDYTRLSTGQRVTVLSVDRGVAYFTGEPGGTDTLTLVAPGAQITLLHGARVRMQVDATVSRFSVIEGVVRLSCPAAEIDIREGQTVRVEPANTARFWLDREVAPLDLDRWNEDRDKTLVASSSGSHVAQRYGVVDLDAAGEWVQTDVGAVWRPKVAEGWAPFQSGRWRWYQALGYTWVSEEAWGWIPYHYGRWTRKGDLGWVWVPADSPVFKPGDVYWLYNAKLAGWGPLAPGEDWQTSAAPEQFLNVNTTYANFQQDALAIDPAGFKDRPKEPLGVAVFALALPSPAFPALRLEATRPVLRVGATRVQAVIPGTSFPDTTEVPPPAPPPMPPAVVTNPASDAPPNVSQGPPPDVGPPGPPMQVIYPVPVYTGIVVLNPPEHPDYSRRNPNLPQGSKGTTAATTPVPPSVTPPPTGTRASAPGTTAPPPKTVPVSKPSPIGLPGQNGGQTGTPGTTTPPTTAKPPVSTGPAPPGIGTPPIRPGNIPSNPVPERPLPVPIPVSREIPRIPRTESKPENKPEARPAPKADTKPEAKPDSKPDSSPVKKQ